MRVKSLHFVILATWIGGASLARADKITGATVSGNLTRRDNQFCGTAGNALVLTFPELTPIDDVVFRASFEGRVEVTSSDGSMATVTTLTGSGAFTDAKLASTKSKTVTLRLTTVGPGDSVPCISDVGFLAKGKQMTVLVGVDQKAVDAIGTELVAVRKAITGCDEDQLKKVARFPMPYKHLK